MLTKKYIYSSLLATLFATTAMAQSYGPSTLNAMGGSARIGSNTFEYSVGEMVLVSTMTTNSIIVTNGLLQPLNMRFAAVSSANLNHFIQLYPNPTSQDATLEYNAFATGTLSLHLIDMLGKTIYLEQHNLSVGVNRITIPMQNLAAATYMLQVNLIAENSSVETTSYKIQKLQ